MLSGRGRRTGAAACAARVVTCLDFLAMTSSLTCGAVIALVSLHNVRPVEDPMQPLGWLDSASLLIGVHERSAVAVLDVNLLGTTAFFFVFHRRVASGTFQVAKEKAARLLPSLFPPADMVGGFSPKELEERVQRVVGAVEEMTVAEMGQHGPSTVVLVRISALAVRRRRGPALAAVAGALPVALANSSHLRFDPNELGTLGEREEGALQWLSVNLAARSLAEEPSSSSALVLDVGEKHLDVTLAVSSDKRFFEGAEQPPRVLGVVRLRAFGRSIKLVTLRFEGMGLLSARLAMITADDGSDKGEHEEGTAGSTPSPSSFAPVGINGLREVRSQCVNPLIQTVWSHGGRNYHVMGKKKPDYERVRERGGPFAGKKTVRPVASHAGCHRLAEAFIAERTVNASVLGKIRDLLVGRPVFMEGQLLEKAMERGLTFPYM